jgi:hypothetical protein
MPEFFEREFGNLVAMHVAECFTLLHEYCFRASRSCGLLAYTTLLSISTNKIHRGLDLGI